MILSFTKWSAINKISLFKGLNYITFDILLTIIYTNKNDTIELIKNKLIVKNKLNIV